METAASLHSDFLQTIPYLDKIGVNVILLALLCLTVFFIASKKKRNLPPGPFSLPIVGYLPFLGKEPYKTLAVMGKKYGNVFGLYLGRKYVVILNEWEGVKEAFTKSSTANRPPGMFDSVPNGFGFGGANGPEWAEQRKFSVKTMKEIGLGRIRWEELVQEEVNDLVKLIQQQRGKTIDVHQYFGSTFASNIMTLMLGHRLPFGHPDVKLVSESVDVVMQSLPNIGIGNFLPWLRDAFTILGIAGYSEVKSKLIKFCKFVSDTIEERIKKQKSRSLDAFIDLYYKEMQDVAKEDGKSTFTEKFLHGTTQVLLVGGSETSKTSMTWLLLAMAKHPAVQKKVYEELISVTGKEGRITWADRNRIPYTYAVMMESMRWKTTGPVNGLRMTFSDIQICGYDIPKDTIIIANNWALHNDPKYWPEPEKFDPERFLVDEGQKVNSKPESYVPFSYGKRSCPGELIALVEILLYFSTIVQKFEILPPEGEEIQFKTVLGLTYQALGLKLRFIPRE